MKTKFHLTKRMASRHPIHSGVQHAMQAVALVDERYLLWLAQQKNSKPEVKPLRQAMVSVFAGLARASCAEATLLRAYLFTDQPASGFCDDLVLRMVPQHAVDGGLGLVRSLGLELTQLAARGGSQMALIASDDERLIPYIDEAQWLGLKVVMLADEASQDMGKMMLDDPSWARLLLQADRCVALNHAAWQELTLPGFSPSHPAPTASDQAPASAFGGKGAQQQSPSEEWQVQVQKVIADWWQDETDHARMDLYEEMQHSQGVPPETDRHLLLLVRRTLDRTLVFAEKKAMREMIRATVMAHPPVIDENTAA